MKNTITNNVNIGTVRFKCSTLRLHIYKTGHNHLWVDSDVQVDIGFFGRNNGTGIFGIFDDHSDGKLRITNYQSRTN